MKPHKQHHIQHIFQLVIEIILFVIAIITLNYCSLIAIVSGILGSISGIIGIEGINIFLNSFAVCIAACLLVLDILALSCGSPSGPELKLFIYLITATIFADLVRIKSVFHAYIEQEHHMWSWLRSNGNNSSHGEDGVLANIAFLFWPLVTVKSTSGNRYTLCMEPAVFEGSSESE
eukprot:TRINITY_DN9524_c0_g1_i2.p1 TRINITY_DN9524_c0_g1~~TRINITY_DN9524_c0_g1_i2.p1  ORF type:complete len:176 (-),score=20.08 TRINITY_DN9524_c0_g1_i2:49-576(-)